jgi:hypothetical protein
MTCLSSTHLLLPCLVLLYPPGRLHPDPACPVSAGPALRVLPQEIGGCWLKTQTGEERKHQGCCSSTRHTGLIVGDIIPLVSHPQPSMRQQCCRAGSQAPSCMMLQSWFSSQQWQTKGWPMNEDVQPCALLVPSARLGCSARQLWIRRSLKRIVWVKPLIGRSDSLFKQAWTPVSSVPSSSVHVCSSRVCRDGWITYQNSSLSFTSVAAPMMVML